MSCEYGEKHLCLSSTDSAINACLGPPSFFSSRDLNQLLREDLLEHLSCICRENYYIVAWVTEVGCPGYGPFKLCQADVERRRLRKWILCSLLLPSFGTRPVQVQQHFHCALATCCVSWLFYPSSSALQLPAPFNLELSLYYAMDLPLQAIQFCPAHIFLQAELFPLTCKVDYPAVVDTDFSVASLLDLRAYTI